MFFLFFHKNICSEYSIEVSQQGTSNEYPQDMFTLRNKKNINTGLRHECPSLVHGQTGV